MKPDIRSIATSLLLLPLLSLPSGFAQSAASPAASVSVPTFTHSYSAAGKDYSYTVVGSDPAHGGTTTIPTVLVPITLSFDAPVDTTGRKATLDARPDVSKVVRSPIFQKYAFPSGKTQYADAMQRTAFYKSIPAGGSWHTLLSRPKVVPVKITVPVGYGYVLTSKKTGRSLAVVDIQFLQKELFKQLPKQGAGSLVIALTKNVTYYALADATVCCSWGTHGVDTSAGSRQSFVLGSYLEPNVVAQDSDIQPLTQQLAQWFMDPLLDPLARYRDPAAPGNTFPGWMHPEKGRGCGGTGVATSLFLMTPMDNNPKNTVPASEAYAANVNGTTYHLQNVALLPWYTQTADPGSFENAFSFPDAHVLTGPATPCPVRRRGGGGAFGSFQAAKASTVAPIAMTTGPNGHQLIGYWSGYGPIRDVSPQWDIIIVAFATPVHGTDGLMQYKVSGGQTPEEFKADILAKQREGKKVMISLGGGGQYFTLATQEGLKRFVSSVEQIVEEYHFDGVDLDYETPSFSLDPGDNDFRHPTTPGTVNIISAMHQLRDHFGPKFMISLVPEGTQIPSGYPSYGGQFGSYIPILQGIRDILTFVDTQDYNTPPLEGLDGEFYMPGTVDYHAAMTELVLHGFPVGRDPKHFFEPLPPEKVAIGFLNGDTTPEIVMDSMRYLITGKSNTPTTYKLLQPGGYPSFNGAMFWTIDADRRENYRYSNTVGPLLHSYPASSSTATK